MADLSLIQIANCELSVRTTNALHNAGCVTLADVVALGDDGLLAIKGFGRRSLREIGEVIDNYRRRGSIQELREQYGIGMFEAAGILKGEHLMRCIDEGDFTQVLRALVNDKYPKRPLR